MMAIKDKGSKQIALIDQQFCLACMIASAKIRDSRSANQPSKYLRFQKLGSFCGVSTGATYVSRRFFNTARNENQEQRTGKPGSGIPMMRRRSGFNTS